MSHSKEYVARMRKRFDRRRKAIYRYLVKRRGEKCEKCGRTGWQTIDHIKKIADGGDNDYQNLQLLCPKCHKEKDRIPKRGEGKRARRRAKRTALGISLPYVTKGEDQRESLK